MYFTSIWPSGDGPKLVRELFRVADELAPSIVFMGECACADDMGPEQASCSDNLMMLP